MSHYTKYGAIVTLNGRHATKNQLWMCSRIMAVAQHSISP